MKDVGQQTAAVAALRQAVPYIRMFKGKTFVLKVGGAALGEDAAARKVVEQVHVLHQVGVRVVMVHGGGPQSSALSRALGAEPRFVAGRRVTDDAALEVATLVLNGAVNTRLLAACRAVGLPAAGVSGVTAGLVTARRRPPVTDSLGATTDYGHVGDIVAVDPTVVETLLAAGLVPVVSPLSADADGALLNINADTAAAALAVALRAEKLLLLTGAPGILERADDPGSLVSLTDLAGLARLRERGCLAGGMLPKASSIEAALRGGVRRVHVVGADVADSLLAEIFTNEGVGTMVVADSAGGGAPAAGVTGVGAAAGGPAGAGPAPPPPLPTSAESGPAAGAAAAAGAGAVAGAGAAAGAGAGAAAGAGAGATLVRT
jgi:acetylglutamate kinase